MENYKALILKRPIELRVMIFLLLLTSFVTICLRVLMKVLHFMWEQKDQLLILIRFQKCPAWASLLPMWPLPNLSFGTEEGHSISSSLTSSLKRTISLIWSHTFQLVTLSTLAMYQKIPINRCSRIEVSMTARSLSIDSMRITPHTSKLQVLSMSLHSLLSKRITQQE